ncbi:MAG: sulfatase-like hydrolase/transferase, partial [Deltaproteobacteria bacterium]|nr:sulfatase-like hydrolase/transferase [Deltaproteobacteria bacterium]
MHKSDRSAASFLLFGMIAGSAVGALDVLLGCRIAAGGFLPLDSFEMLAVVACWALVLPGGILGLACYAVVRLLRNIWKLNALRERLARPSVLLVLSAAIICGVLTIVYLGYARGIQVDAIDFRPLALFAFAVLISVAGGLFLSSKSALAKKLAAFYLAASIGGASACIPFLGRYPGTLPFVETRTVALRLVVGGMRHFYDGDGDGFVTSLCELDCDCDDADPRVHPTAVEVPENGIDEDCNGKDLVREETPDIQAKSAMHSHSPKDTTARPAHVLLITIDALRADHMHMYGYKRDTTPHLDNFAAKNTLFLQSRSPGPSTRHSFPTLLTGRHFSSLKLKKGKKWSRLLPRNATFAEYLKEKGYRTRAVVPYFRFKERSGFSQGFDSWTTVVDPERDPVWDPTADLVTDVGRDHLDELSRDDEPWLLWLHYFDPHGAYVNHEDQKSFGTSRVDRYDGEILFTDGHINRLFEHVRSLGLWDSV